MIFSVCLPAVFAKTPIVEAFKRIRACGLDTFEIWGWQESELSELKRQMDEHGMKLAAMCTKFVPLNNPERREEYISGLRASIKAARALNCPTLITQVGQNRPDTDRAAQHACILAGLRACAPHLEEAGITLTVEPLNTLVDHKGYYLSSSDEGFQLIRETGSPNVKLLYDVYHQQIMEGNIVSRIRDNFSLIGHIHIAGVPGRHEPLENSEVSYPFIFQTLRSLGYKGAIGLEFIPLRAPEETLRAIQGMNL